MVGRLCWRSVRRRECVLVEVSVMEYDRVKFACERWGG